MTTHRSSLLVFVNERPVRVAAGADATAAVAAFDPALADRVAVGEAYLTDGRGLRLTADRPLTPGDILRVVTSARRPEAHADP